MAIKLIIALDFNTQSEAIKLINQLDPTQCALKVGNEMFTLFGPEFIRDLVAKKFKVFLDLKYHDIPNTVAQACKAAASLGVWMVNVHASGGLKMMQAAHQALLSYGPNRPLLIAVTVLTSMDQAELHTTGVDQLLEHRVRNLSLLALKAGCDGVVSSALEVPLIKAACGPQFLTVTPGIRLGKDNHHDQVRVITPEEAIRLGSDYLVIGRSITGCRQPNKAISKILSVI